MFILEALRYQHIIAIDHLEIPHEKITCLLGDSGGGKTTLLKLLVKLISPESGTITYQGTDIKSIPTSDYRKKVIYLPQKAYIFKRTIKENLSLGLDYHKKPYTDDDLNDVLNRVKLDKALEDDATHLSGGEQQRLALARILLLDADVYLLDEPSSALDDQSEDIMIKVLIDYIRSHQKTLVMVTHNKIIAQTHADHIIDLNTLNRKEAHHD
jgi:putative ABC transport system ATP-binding protein